MLQQLNLKEIERKAWRSTFQDGLWDIYLGLILFSMALSNLLAETSLDDVKRYMIYIGLLILSWAVLWAGKRFITVPRMGRVKFGPLGESRRKKTRLVLFISVAFGVVAFLVTGAVARGEFGQGLPWKVIIPIVYALNMLIVFGLGAYFLDFPRLYLIAVLFALSLPAEMLANTYLHVGIAFYAFAVPALIIVAMGLFYFVKFVRENPVLEVPNDPAGTK